MFVIEGLRGNRFVDVPLPSSLELFHRLGGSPASNLAPSSTMSGDELLPTPSTTSKIDMIISGEEIIKSMENGK